MTTQSISTLIDYVSKDEENYSWYEWNTFCTKDTTLECKYISLNLCPTCQPTIFWAFFSLVLLLALWIVVANSFVITFVFFGGKPIKTNLGYTKASLAISDIMTGILLLSIALPNIVWTLYSTSDEVLMETIARENSVKAAFGASFFMLCVTSTLFHLVFMSYNRFAAVKWPLRSKKFKPKETCFKLVLLWIASLVVSLYPVWFRESFDFEYSFYTFYYLPNITVKTTAQLVEALGCLIIVALPYFLMTLLTTFTAVLIRSSRHNVENLTQSQRDRKLILQREKSAYKTLIAMEIGFTATLLPAVIVLGFTYTGYGNDIAMLVVSYLGLCNSAINVIIYRMRDEEFQKYLKSLPRKSIRSIGGRSSEQQDTYRVSV